MKNLILIGLLSVCTSAVSERLVLSDLHFFKELGVEVLQTHPRLKMGVADLSGVSEERLHQVAHALGRCGGFEELSSSQFESSNFKSSKFNIESELELLEKNLKKEKAFKTFSNKALTPRPEVSRLAGLVSSERLKASVSWMESFHTRYHRASEPNKPVFELERRLKEMLKSSSIPYEITLVNHSRTEQKSVKLTFKGKKEPNKKIILGAHFDSIAGWGHREAPGADDNASGSSNLIEVARILSQEIQPDRTIEFFWYAGEEGGLIGSSEIAKSYKDQGEQVMAVMQLDMTAYPGDGPFVLGMVTDYTTSWVRDLLGQINQAYFNYQINEFKCGYACSDHASWYRQGFHTVAPFEARMNSMNRDIHSSRDRIQPSYNFEHSAAFSKLALAFAMEMDRVNFTE